MKRFLLGATLLLASAVSLGLTSPSNITSTANNNDMQQAIIAQTARDNTARQMMEMQMNQMRLQQRQAQLQQEKQRQQIRQQQIKALNNACEHSTNLTYEQRNTCQQLDHAKRFNMPINDKQLGLVQASS